MKEVHPSTKVEGRLLFLNQVFPNVQYRNLQRVDGLRALRSVHVSKKNCYGYASIKKVPLSMAKARCQFDHTLANQNVIQNEMRRYRPVNGIHEPNLIVHGKF